MAFPKGGKHTEATKAKMRAAHLGKPAPWVSEARKGTPHPENCSHCVAVRLTRHPESRGEEPGYKTVHFRASRALPRQCQVCGRADVRLECALRVDAPEESLRFDGAWYSIAEPELGYVRLCVPHHRQQEHFVQVRLAQL